MNSPCQPESEAILSTLPYGYLLLDSGNSILVWNAWLEKHTGISKANAVGKALTEVIQIQPSKLNFLKLAREQNRPYILSAKLHGAFLQIPLKETNISGFSFMQQETHILPLQGGGALSVSASAM